MTNYSLPNCAGSTTPAPEPCDTDQDVNVSLDLAELFEAIHLASDVDIHFDRLGIDDGASRLARAVHDMSGVGADVVLALANASSDQLIKEHIHDPADLNATVNITEDYLAQQGEDFKQIEQLAANGMAINATATTLR